MIVTAEIRGGELASLIGKLQSGDEVLLTQGNRPVARLVPTLDNSRALQPELTVRSIKGHRVLTPHIRQEELADDLFGR